MSSKTDKYAILSGKQGLPASEMYKYKPRETTSTYSDFTSNTPSRFSLRSFDITPTVDVENTRKAFDGLYDNILSLYSQNGAGQAISGDYRYLTDSLIANALGKDYTDVAKNHSYYVRAITGENMDDKSFAEAFGDAWTSYYTNRSIAWKQLMFDWSNDEEEKANLLGDIADLEDVLVKKGDYSNRGFVAKNLVASAPVMNQIIEAVGITLAGNVIGSSVAGVGASVSMGNALKNVATASKLAKVGTGLGIATNVANTFTVETGSLSRELYNMTDENGNRISDTQRKVASMLGGAVVTALEYATPDPFFGFTKLGKGLPKSVAKQSFGKWLATAGLNRIKDASSESFEEGLQSVASYIAKDIAKWYGNNSGDTNFNLDSAEQSLYNAIVEGVDSFKDTFTPMLVASFLPGTARDLTTLRRSIKNSRDAKMHEKNSPTARRESGKWQAESADPNVISMDLINLKAGGYDTDYSLDIDENGKAKKLGKVNVIQDPNNPDMFIGATEKDDDILKWAYDKKFKAVDVNVLEYGSAVMDEESIGNIARAFGGDFKDGIATVDSKESLDAMEKTLEDAGLSVNTGDGSFTFTNEETGKETTVRIATQDERDVASAMSKSEGVISNRDFVKEIKNALTADGQIETQVTDDEIALVSSLAGMLGNDVTSKMEFVSAYSDNVSLDEAEAVGGAKGATVFSSDATKSARIILSDNSDASTVAHEMFHVALRYNESARGKLVDAVSKTVSNKNSRRGLRQFLSEHTEELKRAGIQNVDDAMRILDGITRDNVLSTAENQEVLTSMFEMYNNSESKAKERMPSALRNFFKALYDTFRRIYKNVTGKSLMPEGLASAYSSFVENNNAQSESTILNQAGNKVSNNVVYAGNNEEAIRYLKEKQGKDIVNKHDGTVVRFGSNGRNKMISNKARGKSLANGFTAWEHNTAASNVDILFENSLKISEELDRDNNANVRIMRYETPIRFIPSSKTGYAEMLVKKSLMPKGNSNTLYTIELTGIRKEPNLIDGKLSEEEYRASSSIVNLPSEPTEVNSQTNNDSFFEASDTILFQRVSDVDTLKELNSDETIKAFRTLQEIDGKLYPPMATIVNKEYVQPIEMNTWYRSDENPSIAYEQKKGSNQWYFKLNKGNGSTISARYNPYIHSSLSPLNDQFSSAYKRPNLVTVEVEIPKSDIESGYKADKAKDTVGIMKWHSGPVSTTLAANGDPRKVILSRYCKVTRIVPDSEVALLIKKKIDDIDVAIPTNTVTPSLLRELNKLGVKTVEPKEMKKNVMVESAQADLGENSKSNNDSILYQSNSPEENVAREFSSDRNASQRYTFAYFTEKDVSDMIDAGIYVPPMLLDKYPENEAVIREKSDRLMMENFLVDNEVRKALVASKNVEQFLESMRQYYDTAYNANTEAILRKIYAYDKMQTPSQMRAWFKSEYATGNIDKLMELKAMVGLRRSTKISKNGKVYTTVSVPDSSFAYNKLMNLDRTSSKEAVKEVTDSIQRNPNPWIRDYIKASQMDYAKKFEGSEVGGYDYLKAKSDLMYLSLGSTEFNLINEIREASKVNDFTPDEIKEQESIKESRKALEREARELQKELKMEGSEPSGTTPLEMSKLFYEDEISAITDRSNEEIAKLKEKMDINSLVSSMREDELKAKYEKKIEKLEAEKNERIAKLNETLKDVRTKRDEQYKELRDKKNQKIDEIREDRNRKLRELSSYYNARISNIKLRRDTTIAKIKLVNRFKKDLKVDHSVYSADIDEVYKWMYCLIRNKQKMGTIDYERYAMKKGETTDSDVLIFSFEPSDYRMSIDEENTSGLELNEVDDANSPSLEYEFNPNAYNFDRTDVPLSLMEFGFSPEALREITDPERRFDSFSYDTLVELYEAFSAAKRISKATKSAMDSAKRQKRAELAGKMYGTIARTEAGIPADALHAVLRSIGATEEEYRHDPDVRAKAMSEFTKGISRYSDILQHKLTARDRFFSFASNSIGHIQWVADFLESNKNGAFHKLFVDRAQTALNNYEAMRRKRTREAMDAIKSAAGGDEMWAKIHKELTSKDASIDVTYNQNGTKLDEYSYRSGKITLNQALGIYIYAKNYQSLGNLLSGKGNNFSLETLARINPEAMKRFLGEEMAMRDEFVPETKFFTDSRGNIIPYKTRFTDSLFKNNTKAEIYDVYGRLVNGEFDNGMPSWFSKIGDAIVETLSGKDNEYTNRLAKFSAEVLNNPFTFQESYFPKVSDGRVKVSAIGEVSGAKSKHVSTGAVKDRQTAFNYPLRLDPINVMLGAIEAQERMVNMYETVSDMNYLMSDKGSNFGAIISARYGDGMRKFIESQIADLAGNKPILSDYEKLGNVFLQNVSTSKIALNFMTALKQFLSVFPATFNGELKMHDLLNGVALASGNNKTTADALYRKYATDVADSSLGYEYTMMKRRMEATGLNTMRTKLLDFSMGFTNWSDQKVKKWVFMGAFDKYLKQGMSEGDAGLRATEIVKKTQSIGDSYSLSNFERNRSPFVRAFAMFSKDMFNIWNSIVFGAFGADVNNKDFFQIGERMLGIGILSLASALVAGGFIPDDDDDGAFDEDAFFEDLYSNLIGYVPFFGTFFSNDGSDSLLTEPVMKIKDMFDTVGSATMKISEGEDIEEEANKFINAGLDALGAVGVPSVAVKRAIKMFAPDGLISDDYAFNPGWLFGKTGASTFNLVF